MAAPEAAQTQPLAPSHQAESPPQSSDELAQAGMGTFTNSIARSLTGRSRQDIRVVDPEPSSNSPRRPIAVALRSQDRASTAMGRLRAALGSESLYGNSAFLFLNTAILAAFGLVFWTIGARVYTTTQVGVATALIAALNLITSFALAGLEISLIRFLPDSRSRVHLVNASLTWTAALAMLCGAGFILLQPLIAPRLGVVRQTPLIGVLFVVLCAAATGSYIVESVFVAYRSSRYVLLKNTLSSIVKLPLLFALVFAGAFGIYSSWMVSLVVAVLFGLWILKRRFQHRLAPAVRLTPTPGMTAFSLANYLATLAESMPQIVLPLLVLDLLGAVPAAHYYMAMMLASLLFAVSQAAGQALFAEGSHSSDKLSHQTRKTITFIAVLLLPGILATIAIGPFVLSLFGPGYARSAHWLLTILALSAILVAINDALRAIHKVHMRNTVMFTSSALGSAATVALCFPLAADKLAGIGLAWCGGQLVTLSLLAVPLATPLRHLIRPAR